MKLEVCVTVRITAEENAHSRPYRSHQLLLMCGDGVIGTDNARQKKHHTHTTTTTCIARLERQVAHLEQLPFGCKMGGATGNCAAHVVAYPEVEWETAITKLASRLGLQRQHFTTQVVR